MAYYRDGILYVDNSTLATFAQCETRAMVRYGYNLRPASWEGAPLRAGTAIHKAIEVHYTGGSLTAVLDAFDQDYYEWATRHVAIDDRLGFNNVRECVESWVIRNPLNTLPYTIPTENHVEMPFDFQLHPADPSIRYVGRVDALVGRKAVQRVNSEHVNPAALYVLDTKSTGQPWGSFSKQFELSPQLTGYVWAATKLFPDQIIAGCYINVIHTYMIPRQDGRCSQHKVPKSECRFLHPKHALLGPLLRSSGEILQWRVDAYNLAKRWKQLLDPQLTRRDLNAIPASGKWVYNACSMCELLEFCRSGRNIIPSLFVEEEWIPGDLSIRS